MTEETNEVEKFDDRVLALAKHLSESPTEIEEADYGDNTFKYGREEWLVLTDDEADAAAREQIEQSLWSFSPSFIARYTGRNLSQAAQKALGEAQEKLCEDANDLVGALIHNMDEFVRDAINELGREHFLSQYDGAEWDAKIGDTTYYLYRTN